MMQDLEESERHRLLMEDKENIPTAVEASGDHIFPVDIDCPDSPAPHLQNNKGEISDGEPE